MKTTKMVSDETLKKRREWVFLILSGVFLGSLAMLNILGISRFIVLASWSEGGFQWGTWGDISFSVAVGVLPYPITFLCTDLLSEFYGRERANRIVWVGLLLNVWVVAVLWVGASLPPPKPEEPQLKVRTTEVDSKTVSWQEARANFEAQSQDNPAIKKPELRVRYDDAEEFMEDQTKYSNQQVFFRIKELAFGAVVASMIAFMAAQFCDVFLYHFWKNFTKGKHLWLRNNGSTLVSQLVDTVAVILITHYYANNLPPVKEGNSIATHLFMFIISGYVFKLVCALVDTIPVYGLVWFLSGYLQINPSAEYDTDSKPAEGHSNLPVQTIYGPEDESGTTTNTENQPK